MWRASRQTMITTAALAAVAAATASARAAEAPRPYSWRSVPFGAGGFVDGFLFHPRRAGLLYARTDIGGAYRFDYAERRWIPLLDQLGHADGDLMGVLSMAVDPNDPNRLYLACGEYLGPWARTGAVLRSDDQGRTWKRTELNFHLGANADGRGAGERLQVDPNAGDILFLGSSRDGLWKSTDAGASFAKAPGSPAASITLVLFDPASGAQGSPRAFPGSHEPGKAQTFFRWRASSSPNRTTEFTLGPAEPDPGGGKHASRTIYVGAADGKGGLYVSRDGGASFALVPGAPRQTPQHAVFDRDGDLYVTFAEGDGKGAVNPSYATDGGVWKMDRSGSWSDVTPVHPGPERFGYSGVDVDAERPGVVVVSTLDRWKSGDEVFLSEDGGARWTPLGPRSRHDAAPYPWLVDYTDGKDRMGHWVADVKINPFNPNEMVYGTGYGLWMSRNLTAAEGGEGGGATVAFDFPVREFEETAVMRLVSPSGGPIVMAAMGDVGGAAWDDVTKTPAADLFTPTSETDDWIDVATLKPAFAVRTAARSPSRGFYSLDGGASWAPFPTTPYRPDAGGGSNRPGTIAVSAGATALVWAPERQGAFYSLDRGRTWRPSAGWPQDRAHARVPVPVADKTADRVFYVYDPAGGQVLISVDGGASFKPVVKAIPQVEGRRSATLETAPRRMRDLWLAGPFGLLHSAEAGKPMASVRGVEQAWLVGFGKAAPGRTYPTVFLYGEVRGQDGLWRSDDEGASWIRIDDDAHRYGRLRALAGDAREYATVYIAPEGRGVLVGKPQP